MLPFVAAAPYGLTADLEFMPWTYVPDLATANKIVAQAGQPNAGVLVDALHFDRSNSSIAELARVPHTGCTIGSYATARPSDRRRRKK